MSGCKRAHILISCSYIMFIHYDLLFVAIYLDDLKVRKDLLLFLCYPGIQMAEESYLCYV